MSISAVRTWSAITRSRTSSGCDSAGHVAGVRAVPLAGQLGRPVQDRPDLVDLVQVVDALQDRRRSAPGPCRCRCSSPAARRGSRKSSLLVHVGDLVLHEDEVPELHVAVLVDLRAALRAVVGAAVVVELRARAARARDAHRPEVVLLAAAHDPLGGTPICCARCRSPRRRRGRRSPRSAPGPGRSRPRSTGLVDSSQASWIAPSLK